MAVELLTVLIINFMVLTLHLVSQETLTGLTVPHGHAYNMNKQTKLYVCSVGSGLYCSVHRNQVTYMSVEQKPYLSQGVFVYHAAVLSYV